MQVSSMITPAWINYPAGSLVSKSFKTKIGRLADQYFSFSNTAYEYTKYESSEIAATPGSKSASKTKFITTQHSPVRWKRCEVVNISSTPLRYAKYASFITIILPIIAAVVKFLYKADLQDQLDANTHGAKHSLDIFMAEKKVAATPVTVVMGDLIQQKANIVLEFGRQMPAKKTAAEKKSCTFYQKSYPFLVKDKHGVPSTVYVTELKKCYRDALQTALNESKIQNAILAIQSHYIPEKSVPKYIVETIKEFCTAHPNAFSEIRIVLDFKEMAGQSYVKALEN